MKYRVINESTDCKAGDIIDTNNFDSSLQKLDCMLAKYLVERGILEEVKEDC